MIHEPLSRPDVTSLDECSPQNPYLQGSEVGMGLDKSGAPLSSNSVAEEEKGKLPNANLNSFFFKIYIRQMNQCDMVVVFKKISYINEKMFSNN